MIPATGHHQIISTDPLGIYIVEAWDDDGAPMIAGKKGLARAAAILRDWDCEPIDPTPPVLAIPAPPGWTVTFSHSHDPDAAWTEPIVGWAIDREGQVDPVIVDAYDEGVRLLSAFTTNNTTDLEYRIKYVD